MIAVAVTATSLDDGAVAPRVLIWLDPAHCPRLEVVWGDDKPNNRELDRSMTATGSRWRIEIVCRSS